MTETPEAPQAPAPAPVPTGPAPNPGKGLGIAGMVLGIVSIVFLCIPGINWLGIIGAIVGLVLSIIGRKKSKEANAPTGMATAGMVLSIIVLALAILAVIAGAALLAWLGFGTATAIQQMSPNTPTNLLDVLPF